MGMTSSEKETAIEDLKRWLRSKREQPVLTVGNYFEQSQRTFKSNYINSHVSLQETTPGTGSN